MRLLVLPLFGKNPKAAPMAPPLTVRNLTSVPIDLKVIERYNAPSEGGERLRAVSRFAGNITSFTNNITETIGVKLPTGPASKELAENAQSFNHEEVDIRIDPLTTNHTDKQAIEREPNEILRLTFEAEGQRYRIDTPLPVRYTKTLTPLVPDPKYHFTAVFVPGETYLTIFSSANLDSWMNELADYVPISSLSIPGTHNSPTCNKALPSVRCQAVSPREQLNNGIRFFDIRVQPEKPDDPGHDGLILVHGVFPISLTGNKYFRDLANDAICFLDEHPSETIIMSLKREGPGEHTDQQLSKILYNHYTNNERWYTDSRIPKLGEARGKITLLRRFALDDTIKGDHEGRGYAIDAENWAYNTPNDRHGDVIVQDFCEVLEAENIEVKAKYVTEHLERAGCCQCSDDPNAPPPPMYINFLSASNFWKVGCWPEKIAAKLNPAVVNHLAVKHIMGGEGDWGTGVVVCDWVGEGGDWDIVRCVVGMNGKVLMKHRR
jgi:1-phosphatidylinositol phosphodiesterase